MKTRSSRNKRVAGVYLRGKIFWYRCSLDGRQHRLSLDTEDESAAIARAMEIRANPELADINHLKLEIKDYVQHQFVEKIFTRNTVANRTAVLIRDSAFCSSFALPSGAGVRWW